MNKKADLELYTDYLIASYGYATATGLSSMLDGQVSHDAITRFLTKQEYDSKELWRQVKRTVRQIEREEAVLIFDDTIQEKQWTDENDIICWHFDHCKNRSVKGINLLNVKLPPFPGHLNLLQQKGKESKDEAIQSTVFTPIPATND